jgi:integrase
LRFGAGLRERFIISAQSETAALAREARMARMASELAAAGKHAEARAVLEEAGAARNDAELGEVEQVVRELCAESERTMPAPQPRAKTFSEVAALLFAEQLRRGNSERSIEKDRQRLSVIAPRLGAVPVARVTSKLADEAMALVPDTVVVARHLFEGLIHRVLKHARRLELIEAIPLRPDFVSKQPAPARLFQYLSAEEEWSLITGPAPVWRRIGYGLMAREGVRPEFLSLFYWSDRAPADAIVSTIDLDSGLLTHRHKQRRVRRWPVCERVLRVLRAWREQSPESARVLPNWTHKKIARTLRSDLLAAGVDRPALHRNTATERQISAKDAGRATFVTLALRAGAPMHWVTDRTGHMGEEMVGRYNRMAREARDTVRAWLRPLDEALGAELGLEPLSDRYVVPWMQGLSAAELRAPTILDDLGQQVAKLLELASENKALSMQGLTNKDSRLGALVPPPEPKQAPVAVSSSTDRAAGPAEIQGVGQESPVEMALAAALTQAIAAGEWPLAQSIVQELGERRRARTAPAIPSLADARQRAREGRS